MGLLFKALLGAFVVLLIAILARSKNYYIAGLIPLFPTFALIAHYIVGTERSIEALRSTIIFGIWAIIPYFIYLLSLYFLIAHLRLSFSLIIAVFCWVASAWVLVTLWNKFHGVG
ncbi:GlpM family protein [Hafnia alvei]|uniref:GlpM family protein n=1 Tax=Hafnia alvei TaxID=569 RepID=UPI001034D6C8|nr:GlpM family protein [Hafnia alvei]MCE9872245.1 GlpM family protein [Hafnia alvei]TBM17256.1 GlpM family protein [Hafnia alvei]